LFYYITSFKNFSSLAVDVTFGKLEAARSVNSAYQKTTGLNKLADANWKNLLKLINSNTDITPHRLSHIQPFE